MLVKLRSIIPALAAASLFVVAGAGPASAGGSPDPVTGKPATAGAEMRTDKKVCKKFAALTGSQFERRVCKTSAQWQAEGFTVTTRTKKNESQTR